MATAASRRQRGHGDGTRERGEWTMNIATTGLAAGLALGFAGYCRLLGLGGRQSGVVPAALLGGVSCLPVP